MHLQRKKNKNKEAIGYTSDEEKALFTLMQQGDEIARDELIQKYSSWVTNIAKKYHTCFPNIEISELVAEGNRGLLQALERFDINRDTKFSTYAWFWIIKNVQSYINSCTALIDLPPKVMREVKKIINSMNDQVKKGKAPSLEKISKKLDLDLSSVISMLTDKANLSNLLSLDKFLNDEEKDQTLGDVLEDKKVIEIQNMMEKVDTEVSILEMLKQLSPIEQEIIKWRFGFIDNQSHPLKEIGEKLHLIPSKVKDIESVAIIKLKKFIQQSDEHYINNK